jgi:hypothetical protein
MAIDDTVQCIMERVFGNVARRSRCSARFPGHQPPRKPQEVDEAMEDREQRALQESIDGRLATATLLYLTEARVGLASDDRTSRGRLRWLRDMLVQSLGGARQWLAARHSRRKWTKLTARPARRSPRTASSRSSAERRRPSSTPSGVQDHVRALDALSDAGGAIYPPITKMRWWGLEPLLEWLSDGTSRATRRTPEVPRPVGA